MIQTNVVEEIKTYVFCSITYFKRLRRSRDKVEIIVETDRPQMAIWRKLIACWIPKATNTQSGYVICIGFPLP